MSGAPNRDYYSSMRFVKIHDVILLEKGQLVYCEDMPAYYSKTASPYSTATIDGLMTVGVPIKRPVSSNDLRGNISDAIISLFGYYRIPLNPDILNRFLTHQIKELPDSSFLVPEGLYQIYGITVERNGRKVHCRTYRPTESRPELKIYFFLESYNVANHKVVKIITDAEREIDSR